MNNGFPPATGPELGQRHPHLGGLEAQQQPQRISNNTAPLLGVSTVVMAVENLSRGLIAQTQVADLDQTSGQYNLRKNK